jgi:tripeptidyl-peptidase-1
LGRGYPDIAAQAEKFVVINNNVVHRGMASTGCAASVCPSLLSAPSALRRLPFSSTQLTANLQVVAAIVSLLNDFRISEGKPELGFLNLWLYKNGPVNLEIFNDIVEGSNPGCGTGGFSMGSRTSRQACVSSFSTLADFCDRSRV